MSDLLIIVHLAGNDKHATLVNFSFKQTSLDTNAWSLHEETRTSAYCYCQAKISRVYL